GCHSRERCAACAARPCAPRGGRLMSSGMPYQVITALGLVKEYAAPDPGATPVLALRGIDLNVAAGDWLAITGPAGCGKSTLLNVLAGIDPPTQGSVSVLGQELSRLREAERSRLR